MSNNVSETPLTLAARIGDLDKIKKLLAEGYSPDENNETGYTPIHLCVEAKQMEVLAALLDHNPENKKHLANLLTNEHESPLIIACMDATPSLEMVQMLLQAGANPNETDFNGRTAIFHACEGDFPLPLVKLLVENGADVDVQEDDNGFTPLLFAFENSCIKLDLVEYLISVSDVDMLDYRDEGVLNKACENDFLSVVEWILKKSTNSVNNVNSYLLAPLSCAAYSGNLEMVKMLVSAGADVHLEGRAETPFYSLEEETFLPIHSSLTNIETFKFLLQLTNPATLLPVDRFYNYHHHLPIFIMFYAPRLDVFEALLQHKFVDIHNHLKSTWIRNVIEFVLHSNVEFTNEIYERFLLFFKYYGNFEPDNVFELFSCVMSNVCLRKYHRFINILSKIGVTWSRIVYFSKRRIISVFSNSLPSRIGKEKIIMRETLVKLREPVLSLKKLSRVSARRAIGQLAEDDWAAFVMIRDSCLPADVKAYLWYENSD